jgi:aspartate carbamoyltransferase catalytic subunit
MQTTTFHHRNIISIDDLTKGDIYEVLDLTAQFKEQSYPTLLSGMLMGSCFFEPSTRTRLSFEAAMARLGGTSIGFSDGKVTSKEKGETLYDSMKVLEQYVDVITLRHPLEGSAQRAADATNIPVINAGDGANQHPTQTLLDLFSIRECQGSLDGLRIAISGDLKYGRTVHSLAAACAHFDVRLYLVSVEGLEMPQTICDTLRKAGVKFSFHRDLKEVIGKIDILYVTRIQEERFTDRAQFERLAKPATVNPELMTHAKPNLKVLHPLPRMTEIDPALDATPYAYYFQQAKNGLYVRQALLSLVLGRQP